MPSISLFSHASFNAFANSSNLFLIDGKARAAKKGQQNHG